MFPRIARISLDRSRLVVVFLDDFEDISVGIAKEKANERCFSYWFDQRRAACLLIALSTEEIRPGPLVTAMCRPNSFSNREGSNSGSSIKCSSIPGAISSHAAVVLMFPGRAAGCQPSASWKKSGRSPHVARRQSDVCQSHGFGPGDSWVVNSSGYSS